jgi:hypothetical protein
MNITLSTDNPRSLKALQLTAGAEAWLALPGGGFGIPSQRHDGAFYAADTTTCTCPDFQYRGTEPCKHVLAVRLRAILEQATLAETLPSRRRLTVVA